MVANICMICEHSVHEHEDEGSAPCLAWGCSCGGYEDEEDDSAPPRVAPLTDAGLAALESLCARVMARDGYTDTDLCTLSYGEYKELLAEVRRLRGQRNRFGAALEHVCRECKPCAVCNYPRRVLGHQE
jgi:hypothetical protein